MTSVSTGPARGNLRVPVILALLAAALVLVMPVSAHNPTDIQVSYDPGTEKLSVTVTHPVDDPTTHFVNKVQVRQNGRTISDPDYKSQPEKTTFTYTYDVKAAPGDTIWVLTTCNRGGSLEKRYDIPVPSTATAVPRAPAPAGTAQPQAPAAPAPTQKSPAGILPVLGAVGAAAACLAMRKE